MSRTRYCPETDTPDSEWEAKRGVVGGQIGGLDGLGGGWLGWRHLLSQRISNGRTMRLPLPAHLRPGGIFHGYLASQQLVLFWHVIFDEYFYD